jgi:hypothetical protein
MADANSIGLPPRLEVDLATGAGAFVGLGARHDDFSASDVPPDTMAAGSGS